LNPQPKRQLFYPQGLTRQTLPLLHRVQLTVSSIKIFSAGIIEGRRDEVKKVEEALAKYERVDEALEEIKKLSLESYKVIGETDCNEQETAKDMK